jgi:intracellular septation protein
MSQATAAASQPRQMARSFILGGLLPIIAYTIIEEYFGILWGLAAGMFLGVCEIIFEKWKRGKVDPVTWGGNGLLIGMGAISFLTQDGVWFKLQPAVIEAMMAAFLMGSVLWGKPLLVALAKQQGALPEHLPPPVQELLRKSLSGLTFRSGMFFAAHAALATWAALYWSDKAWALLKGVGFTVSLLVYLVVETLLLRYRIAKQKP